MGTRRIEIDDWDDMSSMYEAIARAVSLIPPDDVMAKLNGVTAPRMSQARKELVDRGWVFAKVSPYKFMELGAPDRGTLEQCQYWIVVKRPTKDRIPLTDMERELAKVEILDHLVGPECDREEGDRRLLRILDLLKGEDHVEE